MLPRCLYNRSALSGIGKLVIESKVFSVSSGRLEEMVDLVGCIIEKDAKA